MRHFSMVTGLESLDYIAFNRFVDFVERRHVLFRRQAAEDDLGDKIRKVHVTKLCHLFGVAPSLEEKEKLLNEVPEKIDYAALMDFVGKCEHAEDTVPYLQQFFSLFDQPTHGKMSRRSLVNLLSTWGEKLSAEQAEQIVRLFGDDGEAVDCQQFVANIMEHDLPTRVPRQTRA
ncbi:myosin light chain [Cystoisospora suis]|uniref:Myosin light chain n=1 Tax=Cystoisospora suis TaxID=483139 RepID=A0A2C6KUU3_9APIC|nr:myosin light chain [Cystoisospora suis]